MPPGSGKASGRLGFPTPGFQSLGSRKQNAEALTTPAPCGWRVAQFCGLRGPTSPTGDTAPRSRGLGQLPEETKHRPLLKPQQGRHLRPQPGWEVLRWWTEPDGDSACHLPSSSPVVVCIRVLGLRFFHKKILHNLIYGDLPLLVCLEKHIPLK